MNQVKALYANEKKSQAPIGIKWRNNNEGLLNAPVEFRLRSGAKPMLAGHAAVFDQLSEDLGYFREIIRPGAFTETLKTADVRALFNHDPNYPLGRVQAGTLRLEEDRVGLAVEIDMPDTDDGRKVMTLVERGDISQMSFAFSVPKGGEDWQEDHSIRELKTVNLYDVSPVTFPAYTQTDVGIRKEIRSIAEKLFSPVEITDEEAAKMAEDLRYDSWEACISDQLKKGYSQESADKICGMIKAEYGGASLREKSVQEIIKAARMSQNEKDQHENLERWKERREFLDARFPRPYPSSYQQIIKSVRRKSGDF